MNVNEKGMIKLLNSVATLTSALKELHPEYEVLLSDVMDELFIVSQEFGLDPEAMCEDAANWRERFTTVQH